MVTSRRLSLNGTLTVFTLALCLVITACGNTETQEKVDMYTLSKTMLEADESLPEMLTVNSNAENAEELFAYLSDFEYDKVDSYFLAYSAEGLADEIAVVRVKNSEDTEEALKSLEAHIKSRSDMYGFYEPEQKKRADSGLTFANGSYAVLIVCDGRADVKTAFENAIAGE